MTLSRAKGMRREYIGAILSVVAGLAAYMGSPLLTWHMCALKSTSLEIGITFAAMVLCTITTLVQKRIWVQAVGIPVSMVVTAVVSAFYLEWLHSERFPEYLLDAYSIRVMDSLQAERDEMQFPVYARFSGEYEDGGTLGIVLIDRYGKEFELYVDRRMEERVEGERQFNGLWVHGYPGEKGSLMIPHGSKRAKKIQGYLTSALEHYYPGYVEDWSIYGHWTLLKARDVVLGTAR